MDNCKRAFLFVKAVAFWEFSDLQVSGSGSGFGSAAKAGRIWVQGDNSSTLDFGHARIMND